MPTKQDNQLSPDLLAGTSLNTNASQNSGSRLQMNSSQMSQILNVEDATDRRMFTGMEPLYGEMTFGAVAPDDMHILKVIDLYPPRMGINNIKSNPEQIVIYEHAVPTSNGRMVMEVSYMKIKSYHALHQNFGFKYKKINPIQEHVQKGTRFTGPPSLSETGNWRFGLEANVALMSVPQVIEDGVVVSDSFCKRMKTTGIETYVTSFGSKDYPLNMYGDDDIYKILPDIGEEVNPDGILMATRQYDEYMTMNNKKNDDLNEVKEADDMAISQMSRTALRKIDSKYDKAVYVKPGNNGTDTKTVGCRVLDIRVIHNPEAKDTRTPQGMSAQIQKYSYAQNVYYEEILNYYYMLKREQRDSLRISPAFHALIVKAIAYTGKENKGKMERVHRGVPVDEWRVEVTIEYDIIPTIGYKLSGMHGNKAVIVDVKPEHEMPIDEKGNRVEMIMDGVSITKRMNVGVPTEQYINAASRDMTQRIKEMMSSGNNPDEASELLLDYYRTVNEDMVDLVTDDNGKLRRDHLDVVLSDRLGIKAWVPANIQKEYIDIIRDIRTKYPPHLGPVKYTGMSGVEVTTKKNILVGSMYIIVLEKTGHLWQGCASSKFSPFGTPSKLTMSDRNSSPGRVQPIRFGESEMRLFFSFVGGRETANLIDRTTNPIARKHVQETMLRSDKPTGMTQILDRRKFKSGQGRILSMIRHINECNGFYFTDRG